MEYTQKIIKNENFKKNNLRNTMNSNSISKTQVISVKQELELETQIQSISEIIKNNQSSYDQNKMNNDNKLLF